MGDRRSAIDFYNKGVTSLNDKGNPNYLQHSYSMFAHSCMIDPTYGEAWYQTGNNNFDLNMHHAAVACWRRALQCDQTLLERSKVLCNLAWGLYQIGQIYEAHTALDEAASIDPSQAMIWMRLSLVHAILDHAQTSMECARKAHELAQVSTDPGDINMRPTIEMGYSFALLFNQQYQLGLKHFESRFPYRLKSFLQYPYPKWEGEEGKTVHLVADQGLGDTLSYARFVEAAAKRCRYIHAAVQPSLMRLFTHAFIHLPNVNLLPQPCNLPAADYWSTFVSLPYALGLSDVEIQQAPHISCPRIDTFASQQPQVWKVPDRKLHIGIAWGGSALNDIDKHRNIPLQHFLDLYEVPGIQLYSLQVGERAVEMRNAGGVALIQDLVPSITDVVDTLGLLRHLDLVITCESALGHIATLAQKKTVLPYSWLGRDYRMSLTGEHQLWSKHIVFRQMDDQNWKPVFDRIKAYLQEQVSK